MSFVLMENYVLLSMASPDNGVVGQNINLNKLLSVWFCTLIIQ